MRTLSTHAKLGLLPLGLTILLLHAPVKAAEDSDKTDAAPSPDAVAFFETKIRPVLVQSCIECHRDDDPESGLSLESRAAMLRGGKLGPALVPGKPKESLLISAINHDEFLKMPPKDKLSTAQLIDFTKWVAMGAPWPQAQAPAPSTQAGSEPVDSQSRPADFTPEQKAFWAYQPLKRPELPAVQQSGWVRSPVDAFILAKLEQLGLTPAAAANKPELIRRATYDLTGLPPTREEIEMFVGDTSPDAFAKLVDRLLASPRYGEHWGRHWLDVARFADSNGLDENIAYANAFRYRDYVTQSLNNDKPYDRFVQEQIAGDLLEIDSDTASGVGDPLDRYVATGFLAIGAKMLAEDDPVKMQMDIIDEQLSTLCQAFMGITIGCARCHDHKFDPITAADYYALAGIFKSTQTMENHKVVARWYERPLLSKADQEQMQRIDREIESINQKVKQLQQACRKRVAAEVRQSIAAALLVEREYDRFTRAAATQLAKGQESSDRAYPVQAGYALIEAEGFQRGKAKRDDKNYGQGIGVIISSGAAHVEYDLEVEKPGRYALEIRYAAEDRRPVRVLLDGAEAAPAIAGEITGNWQPEGQSWFVATMLELTAGKHNLRFETKDTPFPHIDKFALVHQSTGPWPFGEAPLALSRVGNEMGVAYPVLNLWRKYLADQLKSADSQPDAKALFELWQRFRNISGDFRTAASEIYQELQSQPAADTEPLAKLQHQLLQDKPAELASVARIFEAFIADAIASAKVDAEDKRLVELRKHLLSDSSPLSGPKKDFESFYSVDEQAEAQKSNNDLADLRRIRPNPPMAMGVTESKPEDLRIHLRGSHIVLGKMVPRRFPQILAGSTQPTLGADSSGRLELAQWMTQPDHPLTGRVMVNRLWHWHFGRGLVTSVDNFGVLGQKPSHPELLDWLAIRLVEQRWSLKQMHRTLMLSQTYQMSTTHNDQAAAVDPGNDWLWRFRRRRLTAEETRDAIIAVGEGLDTTMYGTLLQTENHKYVNSTGNAMSMDASRGRRSLYLPVIRSGVFDVMQTLDFPDPAMISGERQTSTVAPQALLMMNSDLVHEHTAVIARHLLNHCRDDAERISHAYSRILQRAPTIDEVVAAATFVRDARKSAEKVARNAPSDQAVSTDALLWQSLCRVLISSNEFSYVE